MGKSFCLCAVREGGGKLRRKEKIKEVLKNIEIICAQCSLELVTFCFETGLRKKFILTKIKSYRLILFNNRSTATHLASENKPLNKTQR